MNYHQDNWSKLLPAIDFVQAILPHESTGIAPFELEFGYKPRMQWNWKERTVEFANPRESLYREEVQAFAKRAYNTV